MTWVSEWCSTNKLTIDSSVQPLGSLISKGAVSDAYAHGPLETEMFITNATNEWPNGSAAKTNKQTKTGKQHKRHKQVTLKLRAETCEDITSQTANTRLLHSCNWLSYMISVQ